MYPYRNRVRWLMFGRYAHLVHAVNKRRRVVQDTILEKRVESLHRWNRIRFVVSIPLSAGLLATVWSALAAVVPPDAAVASEFVEDLLRVATYFTGVLTILYLFLTRLCGQLEIDILAILTVETE